MPQIASSPTRCRLGERTQRELLHADLELSIKKSNRTHFKTTIDQINAIGQDEIAEARICIIHSPSWRKSNISQEVAEFLVSPDSLATTKQYYIHNALKNCPLDDSFRPAIKLGKALAKATDPKDKENLEVIKVLLGHTPENQFVGIVAALKLGIISEVQAVDICFLNKKDPFGGKTGSDPRLKAYLIGYLVETQYPEKAESSDLTKVIRTVADYIKTTNSTKLAEAFIPRPETVNQFDGIFSRSIFSILPSFNQFCASPDMRAISEVLRVLNNEAELSRKRNKVRLSILNTLRLLGEGNHTFQEQVDRFSQ